MSSTPTDGYWQSAPEVVDPAAYSGPGHQGVAGGSHPPDETQPPQPDPSGLEYCKPVFDDAGLEVQDADTYFYYPRYDGEDAGKEGAKIWGIKRRTFFIALIGALILIAAIGGGVGGGIAARKSTQSSLQSPPSNTTNSHQPSATVFSTVMVEAPTSTASAQATPIMANTQITAVNWNSSSIMFFFQHQDGTIRSQEFDGTQWGKLSASIVTPKNDSSFAAIGWIGGINERQVRIYSVDQDNYIHESVWSTLNPTWITSFLPGDRRQVAEGSKIAAHCWFTGLLSVRLYYQADDGYIREVTYSNRSWTGGEAKEVTDFPKSRARGGLSVVRYPETNQLDARLFYQGTGGGLRSYDYTVAPTFEESWKNGTEIGPIPDNIYLASAVNSFSDLAMRVFFVQDNQFKEAVWDKSTKAFSEPKAITSAAAPGIAAVSWGDEVRIIYQRETGGFAQLAYSKASDKWNITSLSTP